MSAELLRQAATILRERAERSVPAPWELDSRNDGRAWIRMARDGKDDIAAHGYPSTAAYIATMHPGVGLAVARWLEDVAAGWMWDADPDDIQTPDGWPLTLDESMDSHALTVAHLIVGESHD